MMQLKYKITRVTVRTHTVMQSDSFNEALELLTKAVEPSSPSEGECTSAALQFTRSSKNGLDFTVSTRQIKLPPVTWEDENSKQVVRA